MKKKATSFSYEPHRFPHEWKLADGYPAKGIEPHNSKVFGTFICGGGSSMGYKLAGYHHLGGVELDPKVADTYELNHHPEHLYRMDIREFNKLTDLPEELYHLDLLDGSPPCFVTGTKVLTAEGYKNIEHITCEDSVLTHKGRYRKVTSLMSHVATDIVELSFMGSPLITTTENHPFYIRRMRRGFGANQKRVWSEPEWVKAKDITILKAPSGGVKEQDYVGFPINTKSDYPDWQGTHHTYSVPHGGSYEVHKKEIDVTSEDFWRLVGRWMGDGWFRDARKEVNICCNKLQKEELNDLITKAGYHACISEQRTTFRFTIAKVELYEFLQQFGHGAENKHITDSVLNLPKNCLEAFLMGYLSADGYYDIRDKKWKCSSVSLDLLLGIQQIIAKLYGNSTSLAVREHNCDTIEGRKVNTKVSYSLAFFTDKNHIQTHAIVEDGYLWLPVRKIERLKGSVRVFNLSVQEDESYTVYNLAVHNCTTFSISGQREKVWGKEKKFREGLASQTLDDLVFVYCDTILKLKPKCFLLENVKGIIIGNARSYCKRIVDKLTDGGYVVQVFCLNAATLGVPQKRERVFFIGHKKEFKLPKLVLAFNEEPITFGVIKDLESEREPMNEREQTTWDAREYGDGDFGDVNQRVKGKPTFFNSQFLYDDQVPRTLNAKNGSMKDFYHFDRPMRISEKEILRMSTFPMDYQSPYVKVGYLCGMSVPPVMTAQVAYQIYKQWISEINKS